MNGDRAARWPPLPLAPTALVGRAVEVTAVRAMLRDDGARLVTLTGPGGVGKTTLALEVARGLVDAFPDGVAFVPLAPIADPALVVPTIVEALGVREIAGETPRDRLIAELRDRAALLVLDNFERLHPAAAEVAALLAACEHLTILVTSRSPLRVRGEREVPVHPFPVPDPAQSGTIEELRENPAVALFAQRGRDVVPDFALTDRNAAAVAAICRRLDGLPLAIELAASRVKLLPPAELLTRLAARLPLLGDGPRDLPDRLRTMRDAVAWSYDFLTPTQQALFRRLSVFVGGCPLLAAEAIAEGLDDLAALVDNSLLRPAEQQIEPRFAMLETIREYGLEQLDASGERGEARARHAAFYLAFAEAAKPHLQGGERAGWLPSLEREHDNLRAALAWHLEREDADHALRLVGALWRFWWWRSHLREGRDRLAAALALPSATAATSARAEALTGCAALTESLGDYAESDTLYEEALVLWRQLGDAGGLAISLAFRWLVAFDLEDFTRMTALATEALQLSRQLGDTWGIAVSSMELGMIAMRQRDRARAELHLREGLTLFRHVGDDWGAAICLGGLGNVATEAGDVASATSLLSECLTLFLRWDDVWGLATFLPAPARLAMETGDLDRAVRLYAAATAFHEAIGAPLKAPFRLRYEQNLAAARASLGEEAFAAAWAAGRALAPTEAVALAAVPQAAAPKERSGRPTAALSPREYEVLRLLIDGRSARKVGNALFISESTVRTHIENILNKLGQPNQKALIAYAYEHRLI